ncbi:flavin monoamine oxidase family protein [Microbacterium sp. B2969]|uniref:Flavin monoamine oxidase family protein n=1 Tax=Microbacterium alkaliflavum TaxID=3248839 RepID=A0ABW7QGW4_9MICO
MSNDYDIIVIGAGFAGLTAARELAHAGKRVAVLEARDRIGGRTWLDERLGMELELGGTWVHWTQPHVWAELRRYGIGLAPSPVPRNAYWWDGTRAVAGTPDELLELLDQPNELLAARAREVFPQPYAPLDSRQLAEFDGVSLLDEIDLLPISTERRALLESFWTLNFNGRLDDAAFTQALRWVALANGDWKVMFESCATYKIEGGTKRLVNAIHDDTRADFFLGEDVRTIAHDADGVRVVTSGGRERTAAEVIVTIPLHALSRVDFTPALPGSVTDAIVDGQLGLGTKVWFTIEGEHPAFVALGGADWPLNFFQSEYVRDGRTFVIGFGPDSSAIDPGDTASIQSVLNRLVDDVTVIESAAHDWVADPYAQETWPMHRTGFLTSALPALQEPFGHIHFAGADVADGWGGFIDGAIDSGLKAARSILAVDQFART